MGALKRFILWDYPRAGWQYDLMVALILVFIFATPRDWFRDQARASSIVMVPGNHGGDTGVFWLGPELLVDLPEGERLAHAQALLRKRTGKKTNISRLDPIFDAEKEIRGFMASTTQ